MKFLFPLANCFGSATSEDDDDMARSKGVQSSQSFRIFSYNELKSATRGFRSSNKVGEGGFGPVYKGRLKDGSFVAVKLLSLEIGSSQGEREFVSELTALSNARHENLVRLRGCCVDGDRRLLVYDYMENNSLTHTFLGSEQNRIKFSWRMRKEVCLGVARGLKYLHEEVTPHIVHRDVKGRNILLDQDFKPKLSDFGLARLFRGDKSYISTRVAGTLGYLAPEYAVSGHLTRKSDVYSFGVLLLEIVSGEPVVLFDAERGEQFLVLKAWEMYINDSLVKLVDPVLNGDFPEEEAVRFLKAGLLCVQEFTKVRPGASTALKILKNEMKIDGVEIFHPGIVSDLMDVKVGQKQSSPSFSTTAASTSVSFGTSILSP